ncbi:RNA polymerase sigma factor [Actinomadura macrotermitis]|uniref:RNA polymerase sigma factor 70 region 4 type 2 domain-containing protein n=1 Tax=Actinomadura macrotermitis TaxID=2585200 RepID=A0A7K0BXW2_9ACTN|nr:sigma factor-like helix-turn-helix DNA-binding protein [Actinomadura macrotermitis]MQY05926.1 hypothetical protein [Actinomadura macrotermitis]
MDDDILVRALRARDPGAVAAVYDAYGERLHAFCWFRTRDRGVARAALRDALIVAEAHVERLREPRRLGAWLYALARQECARQMADGERTPEEVRASTVRQGKAWEAVNALPPPDRELLELRFLHGLPPEEIAAVLQVPEEQVRGRLEPAQAGLAALLARGEEERSRRVAPGKVFAALPVPGPPADLRAEVVACSADPELAGRRSFVATRVTGLGEDGFPCPPREAPQRRRIPGVAVAVVAVAVLLLGVGAAVYRHTAAPESEGVRTATTGEPDTVVSPPPFRGTFGENLPVAGRPRPAASPDPAASPLETRPETPASDRPGEASPGKKPVWPARTVPPHPSPDPSRAPSPEPAPSLTASPVPSPSGSGPSPEAPPPGG